MKKKYVIAIAVLLGIGLAGLAVWYLRSVSVPVLQPRGTISTQERNLMAFTVMLGLIIILPVFTMTILIAWKYREGNTKAKYMPDWDRHRLAEFTWWAVPIVIISVLAIATWVSSYALDPWKPLAGAKKPLTVQVIALDWKWLFIYPDQRIASVNFAQIPTNRPVVFRTTSDTVMNSFWVPQLGSQIYSMPGMSTQVNLKATSDGVYRGSSANISGEGFAGMAFTVKSTSEAGFKAWVDAAKKSDKTLDEPTYSRLAQPSKNDPVTFYSSVDPELYDTIIMKYMMPMPQSSTAGAPEKSDMNTSERGRY